MNHSGRSFRTELGPCPRCGRDSGRRMVTDTTIELYLVQCDNCGYRTKPRKSQAGATKLWKNESKKD